MKGKEIVNLLYDRLKSDEKILIDWYRENPISVYIEIALIKMVSLEIITESEYRVYQTKAIEKADVLKKSCQKRGRIL